MELLEIRALDGPNLFMRGPTIKLELDLGSGLNDIVANAAPMLIGTDHEIEIEIEQADPDRVLTVLTEIVNLLHDRAGAHRPKIVTREMDTAGHRVLAFTWDHRRFALRLAEYAVSLLQSSDFDRAQLDTLIDLRSSAEPDDRPELLRDDERSIQVIAITGTNGKTTTTRLVSSILMHAGKRVGWTSSSGVLVQGEQVLEGDFTGPAGAARVFEEPDLDVAVLETARGGILLRGIGVESTDVSVVTNVSADHLGLHGVHTIEELAAVKAIVARIARAGGFAVLNADDPLVLEMRKEVVAKPFLVSRQAGHPVLVDHIEDGGWALSVRDGQVHWHHDSTSTILTDLADIPITFGGRALHMLENALCAAAACLGLGLGEDKVRAGLASFRNQASQNRGRLNVYDVDGVTVIVDFAHNQLGLANLLTFARQMVQRQGSVISVIGTAGDRGDDVFAELGTIAAEQSDIIVLKDTEKYLRGREPGEMLRLMSTAVESSGNSMYVTTPSEMDGFNRALQLAKPGDVVAMMCIEDYDTVIPELERRGESLS